MVETTELPAGVTERWELLKTGPWPGWRFWYRQSPAQMLVNDFWGDEFGRLSHTRITADSPSWTVPGMAGVWLSPQGELRWSVPPRSKSRIPTKDIAPERPHSNTNRYREMARVVS